MASSFTYAATSELEQIVPGWREIIKSYDFFTWKEKLHEDERERLDNSWDPYYIASMLTIYRQVGAGRTA